MDEGTPFQTPSQSVGSTPTRIMTPQIGTVASNATGHTPLRDQLSINPDESVGDMVGVDQRAELHTHLKFGLQTLPMPKNDFEIVLPETDVITEEIVANSEAYTLVDASEVDKRNAEIKRANGMYV